MKNRVLGKGQNFKIFQFLTQNILATTNVENPKFFFRTTNLLENMQKTFGGPILNRNTSQKNSRGTKIPTKIFPNGTLSSKILRNDIYPNLDLYLFHCCDFGEIPGEKYRKMTDFSSDKKYPKRPLIFCRNFPEKNNNK